jgi:hypothetical protein
MIRYLCNPQLVELSEVFAHVLRPGHPGLHDLEMAGA